MSTDLAPVARLFDLAPVDWWRYVPCHYCNALRQQPCQAVDGPARKPHAARVQARLDLFGTLWLLTEGYESDVLGREETTP